MSDEAKPESEAPKQAGEGGAEGDGEEKPVEAKESENKKKKNSKDGKRKKPQNCCQKCCSSLMKVVAHDAIYGSFFGPHPVSFLCCYVPCKKRCDMSGLTPFLVASIATKTMYLLMLGIVCLLSAFFIVPWPKTIISVESLMVSSFFPCQYGKLDYLNAKNGGCIAHGGYFMAYRCLLSFATMMIINSVITTYITNTEEDESRAKIHRGFWFYKYGFYLSILLAYIFATNGFLDRYGYFEYTVSILGNIAHCALSFFIITYVMDVAELWVVENRTSNSKWANFLYWTFTLVIAVFDFIFLCHILWNFSMKRTFPPGYDDWPYTNCQEGSRSDLEWQHVIMIIIMFSLVMLTFVVVASVREGAKSRFPYLGWMQVVVLAAIDFFYLWSALYSSNIVNSRPRCNWAIWYAANQTHENIQSGSYDAYGRPTGAIHGVLIIFALLYYTYIHGPRAKTAPMSILLRYFWGDDNKIPVFPDPEEGPEEFRDAIEHLNVWDDETEEVVYSWSKFYIILALGALSLMMAMTNFTNPWTEDKYNSSRPAMIFKFTTAAFYTVLYIALLLFPCSRIYPGYERRKKIKKIKIVVDANDEENILEEEVMEEEYEDEDEVIVEDDAPRRMSNPPPQKCGCLM